MLQEISNIDLKYLSGRELYGDNFTIKEIEKWYSEEKEGYASLGSQERSTYRYVYHAQNVLNGFKYVEDLTFKNVLGFGSAYGHEFIPIINKIEQLTIVEPSEQLRSSELGGITPQYITPNIDGSLNFDNNFDLITCFGVLHHIPNVTFVLSELIRVLEPGGYLLIKEPINTMGDWRYPRVGLTKNERGIPVGFFDNIFKLNNLEVVSKTYIDALFLFKILSKIIKIDFSSNLRAKIDKVVSSIFCWNLHYHRIHNYQKIAPGGIFYVVRKPIKCNP